MQRLMLPEEEGEGGQDAVEEHLTGDEEGGIFGYERLGGQRIDSPGEGGGEGEEVARRAEGEGLASGEDDASDAEEGDDGTDDDTGADPDAEHQGHDGRRKDRRHGGQQRDIARGGVLQSVVFSDEIEGSGAYAAEEELKFIFPIVGE